VRQISIVTTSREAADALQRALSALNPDLTEDGDANYRVQVVLDRGDEIAAVLTALGSFVTGQDLERAAVEIDEALNGSCRHAPATSCNYKVHSDGRGNWPCQ
jgi:hypothetical protein